MEKIYCVLSIRVLSDVDGIDGFRRPERRSPPLSSFSGASSWGGRKTAGQSHMKKASHSKPSRWAR